MNVFYMLVDFWLGTKHFRAMSAFIASYMFPLFLKIELFLFTLYTFSYLLNVFRQTALSFLSALARNMKLSRRRVICVTHGWYCALLRLQLLPCGQG